MLFIVATPIGNLSDLSQRAKEVLGSVDYILCEDTRHSRVLLDHFEIKGRLRSYHRFSESKQLASILNDLEAGKQIALISDAGTPAIADPGSRLVHACRKQNLPVTPIPGANSIVAALCASGFPAHRFQFVGFLPKRQSDLQRTLAELLHYDGTTVCFEAPTRLKESLQVVARAAPTRQLCVARELTKRYEEFRFGTGEELLDHYTEHPPRGECLVLVHPATESKTAWQELTPRQHVAFLRDQYDLSKMDAIKIAASLRGVPKGEVYDETL